MGTEIEERAKEIIAIVVDHLTGLVLPKYDPDMVRDVALALRAERERCAHEAETMPAFASPKDVAAAIRKGGDNEH